MKTARLTWATALTACVVVASAGCSGHSAGFSDAGKYTRTPDSCALLPSALVERLTGAAVAGRRVDGNAVVTVQECSWSNLADASHPNATFGQVTVFVDRGRSDSLGNGVQSIEKSYRKELSAAGCTPLEGLAVDKSCVFPSSTGISLVAFRKSNLFVRVTCSVQNPDPCSGGERGATAQLLAKTVLQKL
jgi:hypothetical protein